MKTFFKKLFNLIVISLILPLVTSACHKADNRTVVKYSSWGSESEVAILKPVLKEFERENPDIKVEFMHIPKNYFQKLHLLVASNLTPDVIFLNNLNTPIYTENNILEDLSEYLKNDSLISEKDFFKKPLEAFTLKNHLYAIPRDVSNLVIYYNKNIFDGHGVPYPSKDWGFEDFLNITKKLTHDTNKDGKIDVFGFGFEENPLFWLPFLWSNGGGIVSSDLKTAVIDRPESIEAMQFYSDLRNKHHVAPKASEAGSATMAQMFIQGKLAMHISGRWNVPRYRKDIDFDWDIAKFPQGKAESMVDADASGWAISKVSKHKKQAWRLISYLASKNTSEKFTSSGLIIPARIDVAKNDIFLSKNQKPNSSNIFTDIIPKSIPTPVNQNYQEILDVVNSAAEPLWDGKITAEQAITSDLTGKINKLLK